MQPNEYCIACKGSGKVFVSRIKIDRKCICTFLKKEEIEDVFKCESQIRNNYLFIPETRAGLLLVTYLLDRETDPDKIDEDKIYNLAVYYGDSFEKMVKERKIVTEKVGKLESEEEEKEVESKIYEEDVEIPEEEGRTQDDEFEEESEEEPEDGIQYHYNIGCLNCNAVRRKMVKLGTLPFCMTCFRILFRKTNPLKENKALMRAWLNYHQDILLGMKDPIKPNSRGKYKKA